MVGLGENFNAHEGLLTARDIAIKFLLLVLEPLQIMRREDVIPHVRLDLHGKRLVGHDRVDQVKFVEELVAVLLQLLRQVRKLTINYGVDDRGKDDKPADPD